MSRELSHFLCHCKAVATCEAEEAAQFFCFTPEAFRWLQLAEQGDVCVPKVHAGGELSTDCHCSSEDLSENSGCGADKTSTYLRVAVHTPFTDPSLSSLKPSGQLACLSQ